MRRNGSPAAAMTGPNAIPPSLRPPAIAVAGKNQRDRRVHRLFRRGTWHAPLTRGRQARPNNLPRRGLPSKFESPPRLELGSLGHRHLAAQFGRVHKPKRPISKHSGLEETQRKLQRKTAHIETSRPIDCSSAALRPAYVAQVSSFRN
jgi:hypothetical protein